MRRGTIPATAVEAAAKQQRRQSIKDLRKFVRTDKCLSGRNGIRRALRMQVSKRRVDDAEWGQRKTEKSLPGLDQEWVFDEGKQEHVSCPVGPDRKEGFTHTVFFDLDETLWTNYGRGGRDKNHHLKLAYTTVPTSGTGVEFHGNIRPNVDEMLEMIS